MEMLACIFRNKTADSVLAAATARSAPAPIKFESQPVEPSDSAKKTVPPPKFDPADPLYSLLCQDKQKQMNSRRSASSRHNRFYGSFRIQVSKSKPFRGFRRGYKDLLPGEHCTGCTQLLTCSGCSGCTSHERPQEETGNKARPQGLCRGCSDSGQVC